LRRLVRARLAAAQAKRVVAGGKAIEVAARKSDDTAEKVQPSGVARAELPRPSNESFLIPQFRSKIDLHPAVTTRPQAPKPVVTTG
jgi:hypothetical protein